MSDPTPCLECGLPCSVVDAAPLGWVYVCHPCERARDARRVQWRLAQTAPKGAHQN